MQTTGPFLLAVGTPLTEYNPGGSYQPASQNVQVQNNSGFQLIVNGGGQQYSVNPFTQTTLPTNGAALFIINAYNVLSNFGGSVTLVWLQQGESAPSPDGTLFAPNTNQGGLQVVNSPFTTGPQALILAAPAVGYAYRIHSVSIYEGGHAASSAGYVVVYGYDGTTFQNFYLKGFTTGAVIDDIFLANGLLVRNAIYAGFTGGGFSEIIPCISYDLVQI